jgi:hypothetical protein
MLKNSKTFSQNTVNLLKNRNRISKETKEFEILEFILSRLEALCYKLEGSGFENPRPWDLFSH